MAVKKAKKKLGIDDIIDGIRRIMRKNIPSTDKVNEINIFLAEVEE